MTPPREDFSNMLFRAIEKFRERDTPLITMSHMSHLHRAFAMLSRVFSLPAAWRRR